MVSNIQTLSQATMQHQGLSYASQLHLAYAWGTGHGAAHVVFFFISLLPSSLGTEGCAAAGGRPREELEGRSYK